MPGQVVAGFQPERDWTMDINEAILEVTKSCNTNPYARAYAAAAMDAALGHGKEGLKVQVAYILANLGQWKGDKAKEVKTVMRVYLKAKKLPG